MADEQQVTDENKRGSILRWRGLMADAPAGTRGGAIALLAVAACAMVATQTNYFVFGETHVIAVLAPITACALLYGPITATLIGALAGLAELIHAVFLPLDVYEAYFASPTNSVFLFALIGLVMGVLYALAPRRDYEHNWQGFLALTVACFIGSVLFSFLFTVSVNAINSLIHLEVPQEIVSDLTGRREVLTQILANFILMSVLAVTAAATNVRREEQGEVSTLRETFQGWLAVVMVIAYLITAGLSYTAISAACRATAEQQMQGTLNNLAGQLKERDALFTKMAENTLLDAITVEELHKETVADVASDFAIGEHGLCAVAENGVIVSSNNPAYVRALFEEVVGNGLANGFDEELYENTRSTQWYMGSNELGYLRATQMGYVRVTRTGNYQIMTALPTSEVYAWRSWLMAAVSAIFIALFAAVYAQASLLLKNVVVRGIDETNETLAKITEGDLDQQVHVNNPLEFSHLSSGINATVGSLKNAIAQESARIERDLATAKAIQESAIPSTFPPFPQISAFDIYANMDAAREVGGDFYDFFLIDDTTLGFFLADVSGKGIPASLFMMAAKTELTNYMESGMDLAEAVQTANWHLCQENEAGMFVTAWAATLNWETGELTFVNAGHNPPLLRHNGTWQWLDTKGGLFLGTFDVAKYKSKTIQLEKGDQLLIYTDGVNEAFNADDEQFGNDRLEAFLNSHADLHPRGLIDSLKTELRAWTEGVEQFDDITMLSVEYGVPPETGGSITVPARIEHMSDVLDLIHGELERRLCPLSVQNQLDMVIEELFVNVCNYAYEGSEEPGSCRIEYVYNANPDSITITLTDWGVPFDPLAHADPDAPASIQEAKIGGLGILMVKRMTDDLSYLRDDDANVVAFRKSW